MGDVWLDRFKREALPRIVREFKPVRVIFFGSRVKGGAREDSDIDVIIISEAFRDVPFLRRMERVLKVARFPKHVDFLCYTPEEFERIKKSSAIVKEAMEEYVEAAL
ncbi:MAG: nucleotidyltransferase domain-containing protein [Euryarchaeota archaeon]|nr:nucleotidyltransferase domain-containing protein [Euryarchaeota archaeon]